eukprot:TRINITY_DN11560_c0_g1_i1.p1 TRINITY_DN11560_c0_g1~~TRINITY_DN11560_c0_g1_i1.p1  ORF type:complete len:321 (+),score=95.51 TRINITY_DN11560_c0_g1_i1:129-1091(+)
MADPMDIAPTSTTSSSSSGQSPPENTISLLCSLFDVLPSADPVESIKEITSIVANLPPGVRNASTILKPSDLKPEYTTLLSQMNESFAAEYLSRRDVLLKRLNVTLQSFLWSDKGKENETEIRKVVDKKLEQLSKSWVYSSYDVFAAEKDLFNVGCSTANIKSNSDTTTSIKNIVIGAVPDRGGRPNERRGKAQTFKSRADSSSSESSSSTSSSSSSSSSQSSQDGNLKNSGGGGGQHFKKKRPRVQGNWNDNKGKGKGKGKGKNDDANDDDDSSEPGAGGGFGTGAGFAGLPNSGGRGGGGSGGRGGGGWGGKGRGRGR